MTGFVLLGSIIILVCLVGNRVASRLGVPLLLGFILLGMLFGTDGLFKIQFDDYALAEQVCSVALIFIMFYGGFGTNWKQARPVAGKALLLSSLGVAATALFTGLFCYYALRFSFLEAMLVGAVISSTDAASVFSVLRSKKLGLKYNTASLLELESGSNDPFSYMLTVLVLAFMGTDKLTTGSIVGMLLAQVLVAGVVGIATALGAAFVLRRFRFETDGFDTVFVFGVALLAYAGAAALGGNGYLSTYIGGILLGNMTIPNKKVLVHFFDGFNGLMQMLIFFLLGLLSSPSQLPGVADSGLAVALFLTFVARPLAVGLLMSPFRCPPRQQLMVAWAGLRGAASIVFAMMATVGAPAMKNDLFHMVFFIVLFSVSLQGSLIPLMAQWLGMRSDDDIMMTFSDYSDEAPIDFIKLLITPQHPWAGKRIRELELLPGVLLVLVVRGSKKIVARGGTMLQERDVVVLSALSADDCLGAYLTEIIVESSSSMVGLPLSQVGLPKEKLVVLIKRGNRAIMPRGKTVVRESDVLVITEMDG